MPTYQNMSAVMREITVVRDSGFTHTYSVDSMRFVYLSPSDMAFIDSDLLQLPIWRLADSTLPPSPIQPHSGLTTDDVPEGMINQYYTVGRARSALITSAIASGNVLAPTSDAVFDALANLPGGESSVTTFNYLLHSSVTTDAVGKLMYAGDDGLARVYQERVGLPGIFYLNLGTAGEAPTNTIVHILFYSSTAAVDEGFEAGVDFTPSSDPATQYQSFKNAVLARTGVTDNYDVSDRGSYCLLFTAKELGNAGGYHENVFWADIVFDQMPQDAGPFYLPIGKLKEVSGDGFGVFYPYTGQSLIASGAIAKNAQLVGTDDGKVRARDMLADDSRDCVVGLARNAAADGEGVTLNYCPRTPTIWLNNFNNRLPVTPQEALDAYMWYWYD